MPNQLNTAGYATALGVIFADLSPKTAAASATSLASALDANLDDSGGGGSGTPATTVVVETAYGQASAVGVGTDYARQDHTHGSPALGTSGATAAAGNDARLSDARTPTAHATSHQPGGSDALAVDAAAATGSLRTLGTGATQAAAGTAPAAAQAAAEATAAGALSAHVAAADPHTGYQRETERGAASGYASLDAGTLVPVAQLPVATDAARGVVELATSAETTAGLAVQASDARLSDARTPTAHATSHQPGGTDPLEVDAAAATGSLRTLGTGATQAAAGADVRFSDARAPTGAASGQLGGTHPGPDVRGLRETAGPTLLTLGAVADGQVLKRVGSTIVGVFSAFMASVMDVPIDITNHTDLGAASIIAPTVVETATWSA